MPDQEINKFAVKGSKPTPRQELIGRIALVVLGILSTIVGTVFLKMALAIVQAVDDGLRMFLLLLIAAIFFYLVAITFIALSFLPAREPRRYGPPRGFRLISAVFDGFWTIVTGFFKY